MSKISAIILFGNRENEIEKCLKSIKWVDEIIGVNIGSNDRTQELIKKFRKDARIVKGGEGFFSKWRNIGANKAKSDWLFYIDTDESVTDKLRKEILKKIKVEKYSAFQIPRKNFFLGKEFKSEWPDYVTRLIKKDKLKKWEGSIHEQPIIEGKIGRLKNPLIHVTHRNLGQMLEKTIKWSWLEAENRYKAGHPPMKVWRFFRVMFTEFINQFFKKKRYIDGVEGWIEGIYQMFSVFITYVRLWQLQNKKGLTKEEEKYL